MNVERMLRKENKKEREDKESRTYATFSRKVITGMPSVITLQRYEACLYLRESAE